LYSVSEGGVRLEPSQTTAEYGFSRIDCCKGWKAEQRQCQRKKAGSENS
jgi:hypothetical protein